MRGFSLSKLDHLLKTEFKISENVTKPFLIFLNLFYVFK